MENSRRTGGDLRLRRGHRVNIKNKAEMEAGNTRSQKSNSSERYKSIYEQIIKSKIQPPNGLTLGSRGGLHPIGSQGILDHTELMDEILLEPSSDREGRS